MALNQAFKHGQVYITGTSADIEADRAAALLVVGRLYWEDDSGKRVGRATANNAIRWEMSQADIDAAVLVETNRATAAEQAIAADLTQEVTDRIAGDDAEVVARQAAITALQTQVATDMAALATALRDERVTDFVGVDYTANQNVALSSILVAKGSETTLRDGIHLFKFNSTDINNEATLSGLPAGAANLSISYNDIVKVVVDGGVAVSASLIDDALKVKFNAIDASITDLQAATTPTAIRSHFSNAGWVTLVNGVIGVAASADAGNDLETGTDGNPFLDVDATDSTAGGVTQSINQHLVDLYASVANVEVVTAENGVKKDGTVMMLGSDLTEDTAIGGAFKMDFTNTLGLGQEFGVYPVFNVVNGTRGTKATGKVEFWFDQDGDPKFSFVPN